jgi:hypothetical protein
MIALLSAETLRHGFLGAGAVNRRAFFARTSRHPKKVTWRRFIRCLHHGAIQIPLVWLAMYVCQINILTYIHNSANVKHLCEKEKDLPHG